MLTLIKMFDSKMECTAMYIISLTDTVVGQKEAWKCADFLSFPMISNVSNMFKQFAMCSMHHLICRQLPGLCRLVVVLCGNRDFNWNLIIFDWYRSRLEFDLGRFKLFARSISSVGSATTSHDQ